MSEPDLFAPEPPYQHSSATSKAAAESVKAIAPSMRDEILWCIRSVTLVGEEAGLTYDEVQRITNYFHPTICARLNELQKMGLIKKSGTTRPTRSKRQAAVYVAVRR